MVLTVMVALHFPIDNFYGIYEFTPAIIYTLTTVQNESERTTKNLQAHSP